MLTDQFDEARTIGTQALALTREGSHRVSEPWPLHLLGEIASRGDDCGAGAGDCFREALDWPTNSACDRSSRIVISRSRSCRVGQGRAGSEGASRRRYRAVSADANAGSLQDVEGVDA
jgi:hypothetical protein